MGFKAQLFSHFAGIFALLQCVPRYVRLLAVCWLPVLGRPMLGRCRWQPLGANIGWMKQQHPLCSQCGPEHPILPGHPLCDQPAPRSGSFCSLWVSTWGQQLRPCLVTVWSWKRAVGSSQNNAKGKAGTAHEVVGHWMLRSPPATRFQLRLFQGFLFP